MDERRGKKNGKMEKWKKTKGRFMRQLLTHDNAISDDNGGQGDCVCSCTDSNDDNETAEKRDFSERESLHHWTAYQTQAARDRTIQMNN